MAIDKVTYELDLDLNGLDEFDRDELKESIGRQLVDMIKSDSASEMSSVDGRKWAKLSESYAKRKRGIAGNTKANLRLSGDMMNALEFKKTDDGIEIGFFDSAIVPRADGHNNHSGASGLPPRKSIPDSDRGETFRSELKDIVKFSERTFDSAREKEKKKIDAKDISDSDFESLVKGLVSPDEKKIQSALKATGDKAFDSALKKQRERRESVEERAIKSLSKTFSVGDWLKGFFDG